MLSLCAEGLFVGYAGCTPILRDVRLDLPVGRLVALVGRNGAGKSTLLRTLAGELAPLAGRVLCGGTPIQMYSRRRLAQQLSFAPSRLMADGGMRVREVVMLGRYPHVGWMGALGECDREAVSRAMRLTRVDVLASRPIGTLSDGERQRVNVALCLAQEAPLLLLDEPASHLDVTHQAELLMLLLDLAHGFGRAVLYSTHDVVGAVQRADAIWLVDGDGVEVLDPRLASSLDRVGMAFSTEEIQYDARAGRFCFTPDGN